MFLTGQKTKKPAFCRVIIEVAKADGMVTYKKLDELSQLLGAKTCIFEKNI